MYLRNDFLLINVTGGSTNYFNSFFHCVSCVLGHCAPLLSYPNRNFDFQATWSGCSKMPRKSRRRKKRTNF